MNLTLGLALFDIFSRVSPGATGWLENTVAVLLAIAAFVFVGSWADAVRTGRVKTVAPTVEPGKPFADSDGRERFVVEVKHHFGKGSEAVLQDAKSYKRERTIF